MVVTGTGRGPVRAVLLAIAVAIAGLVAGGGLSLAAAAALRFLGVALPLTALIVVALLLTQGIGFGGVALGYLAATGKGLGFVPVRRPTARELAWVGVGYVLALAGAILGGVIVFLTGTPAASNQIGEVAMANPEILLVLIPFSFLLIGPGEELLFRGIVQGTLRQTFGPVGAIGLASAIFAAVHFVALTGGTGERLVTIGVLFLPSLVFGTAYERTHNLVVPALIHGAYNATLFSLVYLSLRFAPPAG